MTTVLVTIGNSDDKLTQREWADFQQRVDHLVAIAATEVHGRFHSLPHHPWQTAAWSFTIHPEATVGSGAAALAGEPNDEPAAAWLAHALRDAAHEFRQDSIAWTEGPTTFLTPPACGATEWAPCDDGRPHVYRICDLTAGHDGRFHRQLTSDGRLWAESSGDSGPIPPGPWCEHTEGNPR